MFSGFDLVDDICFRNYEISIFNNYLSNANIYKCMFLVLKI